MDSWTNCDKYLLMEIASNKLKMEWFHQNWWQHSNNNRFAGEIPNERSYPRAKMKPAAGWPIRFVSSAIYSKQGWAGIPVPVHSQEWKPLIPIPELWEWIFSFPSRSRISGMLFFHSLPVPELWEWFFFHSLPVPELWEWTFFIPFPFTNLLFLRRESKWELDYYERYQFFQLPLPFSKQFFRGGKLSQAIEQAIERMKKTGHFAQSCCK